MENIRKNRRTFLVTAILTALACGPGAYLTTVDVAKNNNEPLIETSTNSIDYGYRDSDYIKKIWPKKEPAILTATGDVALNFAMMKQTLKIMAARYGREKSIAYPFENVKDEYTGIAFCNLESPITSHPVRTFSDKDEIHYFRSPAGSEEILQRAGIDVASLANNHIKDCGVEGMFDTRDRLLKVGIAPSGVGRDINEALKPVFAWHRGTRVAILSFNNVIPRSVWADINMPGTAAGSDELLCAAVKKIRPAVDAVVVSIHWGREAMSDYPAEKPEKEQVALAHRLIDSGAACIIGHQSHALGPVELYGNGIIFYSLGDFVFSGRHTGTHRTSMMARVQLSDRGLESYTLIPVNINPLEVNYSPVILDRKSGRDVISRVHRAKDKRYLDYYSGALAKNKKDPGKYLID